MLPNGSLAYALDICVNRFAKAQQADGQVVATTPIKPNHDPEVAGFCAKTIISVGVQGNGIDL